MVLSPSGGEVAIVTGSDFNPRALHILDVATRSLKQTIPIGDSFVGVDFSPSGNTLYVGGGRNNDVKIFNRTVGLVISPYVKRGVVDSSFYTLINMYRTIEQILGLPPLNQYRSIGCVAPCTDPSCMKDSACTSGQTSARPTSTV